MHPRQWFALALAACVSACNCANTATTGPTGGGSGTAGGTNGTDGGVAGTGGGTTGTGGGTTGTGGGTTGTGGGTTGTGGGTTGTGGGMTGTGGGMTGAGGGMTGTGGGMTGTGGGMTGAGGGTTGTGGGTTGTGGGIVGPVPAPVADLRVDSNRDGVVDVVGSTDETDEEQWNTTRGAILLPNMDDDSQRCSTSTQVSDLDMPRCHDAADTIINGPNDLLDLATVRVLPWPTAPDSARARLSVPDGGQNMRLFWAQPDGGFAHFDHNAFVFGGATLRNGVELRMEATNIVRDRAVWNGYFDLTLTITTPKANGQPGTPGPWDGGALYEEILVSDVVRMRVAPVMTFSHITPVETAYATGINDQDSIDFRTDLQTALTAAGIATPLVSMSVPNDDQWTQDFFETGYANAPGPNGTVRTMRVAIRSANLYNPLSSTNPLRRAGKVVFTQFRGPNVAGIQQFQSGSSSDATLDSFGNLETIPPYTHNGVAYPLGRILRGSVASYHPDNSFLKMMEGQAVQPPVYVDTSWLLVGHVDETISFLPANTPRGWIMLVNDPVLARTMLQQQVQAGNGTAIVFPGMLTYNSSGTAFVSAERTISQVLADTDVMQESAAAAVEIDAQVNIIKMATGITDMEIVRVPFLHEPVDTPDGTFSLAYTPGTVNGVAISSTTFASPDPHGPVIGGQDIFKAQLQAALMPYGYTVRWVEDWYLYHLNAGEVHCGSNVTRTIPAAKWWESGR